PPHVLGERGSARDATVPARGHRHYAHARRIGNPPAPRRAESGARADRAVMTARSLLVVSTNRKKLDELIALLGPVPVRAWSAADVRGLPEVEETGATFAENAALKAISAACASGHDAIADDSGLE